MDWISMVIWWRKRQILQELRTSSFECPNCLSSQPCSLFEVREQTFLFSLIPLGRGLTLTQYIECQKCDGRFEPTGFAKSTDEGEIKTETRARECPRCGHLNPNDAFKCRRCEYSLV